VAFDPNIRPALWPDLATMRQSITDMAAIADIVLPSYDDEAGQFGDPDPFATAQRYAGSGESLVVVKDGPRPIVTWQAGRSDRHPVPVPPASVRDTTAAGDSFNAGFLCSYLAEADLAKAVAAGMSLSGRVISEPGAIVRSAVKSEQ
jgi:2-dehydro-3-deoxygluconokinase